MRFTPVLTTLLAATSFVAAQPAPSDPPPAEAPPAEAPPAEAPPAAPPAAVPPGTMPPIVINITNNNNGNNSNTNNQTNSQTNSQPNTQTNTAPVSVSTPVSVAPGAVAPTPVLAPRAPQPVIERIVMHPTQRWITLGVTAGPHGERGARASIDVLTRGALSLGIDGSADGQQLDRRSGHRAGDAGSSVGAYIAWTGRLGAFDLRAQIGIATGGASAERGPGRGPGHGPEHGDLRMRGERDRIDGQVQGEAAVLVGLPLGRHLGLVAGPVISGESHALDVTGFGGVRYRF